MWSRGFFLLLTVSFNPKSFNAKGLGTNPFPKCVPILACSNNKMDYSPLAPGLLISIRSKCSCCNCKPISPAHESDDDIKVYYVPLPVSPSASDKGLVKDKRGNELVKPLISNKSVRAVLEVALMAGVLLCVAVFARGVKFDPFKLTVLALKKFK